jgi:UDP-N-acetylmuramoyl-tripeptide--D-alanyl-D-alanine ligase
MALAESFELHLFAQLRRKAAKVVRATFRAIKGSRWRERFLIWVAILKRTQMRHATFTAVTGSCGKTTTAYLTAAVLRSSGACHVGIRNNGRKALVKNILSTDADTPFFVHEISGSSPGRIAAHVRILRPEIGIITTVGDDHYRNYRSLEATAQEKGRLVELLPRTGIAILNADDPHVLAMASRTGARVVTYGLSPDADVRATEVTGDWPDRLSLTVLHGRERARIQTRLVGHFWTSSVLAAVGCGIACGIDLRTCARAIEHCEAIFGRYSVHAKPNGPQYVFDHKAPSWTFPSSFEFIEAARAARKTMVLGTISDYPGATGRRYRKIAKRALEVADRVVFVGPQSHHVRRLKQNGARDRLFVFKTTYQASMFLANHVEPDELVFIKGSLSVDHLERIMLSQVDQVVCWRDRCRRAKVCPDCAHYRQPAPPAFGLGRESAS